MKKVLIAFDGYNFSEGACKFAMELNSRERLFLIGAFMPLVGFSQLLNRVTVTEASEYFPWNEKVESRLKDNISQFENFCTDHNIAFKVHQDYDDFALAELRQESRFADLVIIGMERFYMEFGEKGASEYLEEALTHIESPVVIVPEAFEWPGTNIIAYDGSESALNAIKSFSCLFPSFADNRTLVVYASEDSSDIPDRERLTELISCHFQQSQSLKLEINPRKFFGTWLSENKNAILVSGAFGRTGLSRVFRKSFLNDLINDHQLPVFIYHK